MHYVSKQNYFMTMMKSLNRECTRIDANKDIHGNVSDGRNPSVEIARI